MSRFYFQRYKAPAKQFTDVSDPLVAYMRHNSSEGGIVGSKEPVITPNYSVSEARILTAKFDDTAFKSLGLRQIYKNPGLISQRWENQCCSLHRSEI